MANNIKIVGNILSTTTVSRYSEEDIKLIQSSKLQENFGGKNDYIEYFIYDAGGNLLNLNYNYLSYKIPSSTGLTPGTTTTPNTTGNIQTENIGVASTLSPTTSSLYPIIEIDPVQDLQNQSYFSGEFKVQYNFFQNKISDYSNEALFIKEISQDRTEIRLVSLTLSDDEIENLTLNLIDQSTNSTYYVDYLLNFGNNEQYVAVNVALNKASTGYEVLFKLYNPLPLSVQEKMTLWVVEEIVNPYVFDINLDKLIIPDPGPILRGPNFNITIPNQSTVSTTYNTYSNLILNLQSSQSSSYRQILNLLATQSIDINVDYTDFNNFIFFGSAYQRVTNFYTKAKQIEDYRNLINKYTPYVATTASLQLEINRYSSSIETIISQFDGYESYLYFESSSYTWPKTNSTKPFSLLSTGSTNTKTWYNNLTGSSQTYDLNNYDNLEYAIPAYIKNNTDNAPFLLFLNMIGHYFDNIWIYLKAITDVNLANNNLDYGISRDLVYDRLKSLGVHLYNTQAGENVNQYLIGANTGSSIFPFTPTSGNDFTITGSFLNNIPRKDLVSELYKRIYHNLPLLLKTKGTVAGLDYLMTTFGIPNQTYYTIISGSISESFYTPTGSNYTSSILSVNEFGGSLKSNLIKGYNNDKVRIVSNTIVPGVSGSILSPLLSLQSFPTSSSSFRDSDMNYVDISFSPQNQIDTYISGAISSSNPTWSLDDYIGDPRQQYSTTYSDLDTQRKLYFETGVSGVRPFTGSLLDYNGFIRLIQYFDNALFKMLEDFTPERTSLSTGVTINSPVLERNKAVYANPSNTTTQSVWQTTIQSSNISPQYGPLYYNLTDDKKPYFTGELSGSKIDVYQYFTDNYNPYLQPNGAINQNAFAHSDWNVLLNNITGSVLSDKRQKIEYIWGTTGSIKTKAELQDSYLSLKSYNTSRYEGSKVSSLKYNTYTGVITTPDVAPIIVNTNAWFKSLQIGSYSKDPAPWVKIIPFSGNGFILAASILSAIANNYSVTIKYSSGYYIGANDGLTTTLTGYFATNKLDIANEPFWVSFSNLNADIGNYNYNATYNSVVSFNINKNILHAGDKSYGKTAAIDRKSYKVGWVKNIPSASLNFSEKTQIQLKYLVDKDQNLTDLSLKNNNLFEVQNIFKSESDVVLSLSDAIKPSFQKTLDGTKSIFKGGYSYDPILFRENNEVLNFRYLSAVKTKSSYAGVKGIDTNWLQWFNRGSSIYDMNKSTTNSATNTAWNPLNFPVPSNNPTTPSSNYWGYAAAINQIAWGVVGDAKYETQPIATALNWNGYAGYLGLDINKPEHPDTSASFKDSLGINRNFLGNTTANPDGGVYQNTLDRLGVWEFDFLKYTDTGSFGGFYRETTDVLNDNFNSYYVAPRTSTYTISGSVPVYIFMAYFNTINYGYYPYQTYGVMLKLFGVIEKSTDPTNNSVPWTYVASTQIQNIPYKTGDWRVDKYHNLVYMKPGQGTEDPRNQITTNTKFILLDMRVFDRVNNTEGITVNLNAKEGLRFRFILMDLDNFFSYGRDFGMILGKPNTTSSLPEYPITNATNVRGGGPISSLYQTIPTPYFSIEDTNTPIPTFDSTEQIIDPNIFTVDESTFIFTPNIQPLLDNASVYVPQQPTSNKYSPIVDTLSIQPGDLLRIGGFNNPAPEYYNILSSSANTIHTNEDNTTISTNPVFVKQGNWPPFSSVVVTNGTPVATANSVTTDQRSYIIIPQWYVDGTTYSAIDRTGPGTSALTPAINDTSTFIGKIIANPTEAFRINGVVGPQRSALNNLSCSVANDVTNGTIYNTSGIYKYTVKTPIPGGTTNLDAARAFYYIPVSPNIASNPLLATLPSTGSFANALTNGYTIDGGVSCTITLLKDAYPTVTTVTVDRPITTTLQPSQNFAILRPKPDETSVIINFKKSAGEVSQTILIPQDANDEIKNKVGDIFSGLNTSLANQNYTQ